MRPEAQVVIPYRDAGLPYLHRLRLFSTLLLLAKSDKAEQKPSYRVFFYKATHYYLQVLLQFFNIIRAHFLIPHASHKTPELSVCWCQPY